MDPRELLKKLTKEARALAIKAELSDEEAARLVAIMGEDGSGTDPACEFARTKARVKALDAFDADEPAGDEPAAAGDEPAAAGEPDEDALAQRVADKLEPQFKGMITREVPALLRGGRGEPEIREETLVQDAVKALQRGQFKSVHIPLFGAAPKDSPRYKALGEGIDHAGGYLVPVERSTQMIELLRARAAVRSAGASVIPMSSDKLEIPRQTGGATAFWTGENQQIQDSDLTVGQVELHPKKLTALTFISSELYADSDPAIEAIVQADLARVMALEEDIAFLRGTGIGNSPTGLENIAGVGGTTLGGGAGAVPTFDDLADADNALNIANAPMEGRAFIAHPRLANTLRQIVDLQGRYVWADPAATGDPPTVWGKPLYYTTQIPTNLNIGGVVTHTNVYYGAWGEFLIGQRKTLELRASDVAGTAFQDDQVWIRAILRVDCNVRHEASFYVMRGVRP